MAASDEQLNVQLNLITAAAEKALSGLQSSLNNTLKSTESQAKQANKSLAGIGGTLTSVKVAAVAAGTAILGFFGSKQVLAKAIEQENAVNGVAIALARTGQYSREALRDLEQYAKQLQLQTTYGDQEILKQISLAQAFGATAEQAKVITRASIELAAATGKSLDEATRQVSKTLGGFAGELGEVNPKIKALTAEQLKAGGAAKVLLEQYAGTAVGQIATFGGALAQNKNVFQDLLEQIGFLITKNPVVIEGIKGLTGVFNQLAGYLEANRGEIIRFINEGLAKILDYAPAIGETFKFLVTLFSGIAKAMFNARGLALELVAAFLQFGPVKAVLNGIIFVLGKIVGGVLDLLSVLTEIPLVAKAIKELGFDADKAAQGLADMAQSAYDITESINADTIQKGVESVAQFSREAAKGADTVRDNLNGAIDAGIVKAKELAKTVRNMSARGTVELKVVNNTESVKTSIQNYQQLLETAFGGATGAKIGGALIQSIVGGLKNGKEGARAALSAVGGAVADAFLPGLGQAVGPLIDVLSQGPDAVRQMVREFAQAIPDLVANIIEAIPVLIEELANQFPIIIERLVDKLPEIIQALVKAMPKVAIALAMQMPKIALALAKEMPNVAIELIAGLVKGAPEFLKSLIKGVGDAIKKFLGLGGSGGVGGGIVGDAKKGSGVVGSVQKGFNDAKRELNSFTSKYLGFKLAKGGEIPPGYPNDSAPARLTSGELVVDRSTNTKLKRALDGGGMGMNEEILLQILSLLRQPQVINTGVRINQREFANIMLEVSRTQQRTT